MGASDFSVISLQLLSVYAFYSVPVFSQPTPDAPNIVKFSISCPGKPAADPIVGSILDSTPLGSSSNAQTLPRIEFPNLPNLISRRPLPNRETLTPKQLNIDIPSFLREAISQDRLRPLSIRDRPLTINDRPLLPRLPSLINPDMDGSASSIRNSLSRLPSLINRGMDGSTSSIRDSLPRLPSLINREMDGSASSIRDSLPRLPSLINREMDGSASSIRDSLSRLPSLINRDMDGSASSIRNSLPVMPEYLQRLVPKRLESLSETSSLLSNRENLLSPNPLNLRLPSLRSANDMQAQPTQEDFNTRSCDICNCLMNSSPNKRPTEITRPRLAIEDRIQNLVGSIQPDSLNRIQRPTIDIPSLSDRLRSALGPRVGAENDQSVMADSFRPSFALPPRGFGERREINLPDQATAATGFEKIIDAIGKNINTAKMNLPKIEIKLPRMHNSNYQKRNQSDQKDADIAKESDNANAPNTPKESSLPKESNYAKELDKPKETSYSNDEENVPEASSVDEEEAPPRKPEEGIKNLIEFVNMVDHVDKYISDKTRHVITRLSDIYHEDFKDKLI